MEKRTKFVGWLESLCRVGLGCMFVYSAWGKIADPGLFATIVMRRHKRAVAHALKRLPELTFFTSNRLLFWP